MKWDIFGDWRYWMLCFYAWACLRRQFTGVNYFISFAVKILGFDRSSLVFPCLNKNCALIRVSTVCIAYLFLVNSYLNCFYASWAISNILKRESVEKQRQDRKRQENLWMKLSGGWVPIKTGWVSSRKDRQNLFHIPNVYRITKAGLMCIFHGRLEFGRFWNRWKLNTRIEESLEFV
jgi:hypothetical protein